MTPRQDIMISAAALVFLSLAAFGYTACATYQKIQDDVPGAVIGALNIAACVAAVQADTSLDTLGKEQAIVKCLTHGFDKLTETEKMAVSRALKLPPAARPLDPSPYEPGAKP